MIKKSKLLTISIFIGFFIVSTTIVNSSSSDIQLKPSNISLGASTVTIGPNTTSFYLRAIRTKNFILDSQATELNNASSLDQIYFRLATIKLLDPNLDNISVATKQSWIDKVFTFQNPDGGFGEWERDYSSVSQTANALEILNWLGDNTVNQTLVKEFLDARRITLTNGYASNAQDSDSDVYSTYQAVRAYSFLNLQPENKSDVADLFIRAQNDDVNTSEQFGGFGAQSNNQKNVYWQSEGTITRSALFGLDLLNSQLPDSSNYTSALNFIKFTQASSGGFYNDNPSGANASLVITGPYTTTAIETILYLNGTLFDEAKAITYLNSLSKSDGGFGLSGTSTESSLRGTYFGVLGLTLLNSPLPNITQTLNFLVNWIPDGIGGFGSAPGQSSTLRETFDAVSALVTYGYQFSASEKTQISSYVDTYRNPDGGYGILNSYSESTLRAVEIYSNLGLNFPNPTQTISFLQSLQQVDGGFEKAPGKGVSYVIASYRVIKALNILGGMPSDITGAISYLVNTQNSDGGFGGFIGDTSDVTSSYRASTALKILGASTSTYNHLGLITFMKSSQVADGGFKRSPSDITLPKNVSNMVHTYSAVRTLMMFNEVPNNISGIYNFVSATRNPDGGFAEHEKFTSNIAYVFTAVTIVKELNSVFGLKLDLPVNVDAPRNPDSLLQFNIQGKFGPFTVIVNDSEHNNLLVNSIVNEGLVTIDTTSFVTGNYNLDVSVEDDTHAAIGMSLHITIDTSVPVTTDVFTTTTTTSTISSTSTQTNTDSKSNTGTSSSPNTSSNPNSGGSVSAVSYVFITLCLGIFAIGRKKFNKEK